MPRFLGIDHIDVRVPSLKAVERFYDKLMPVLGLPRRHLAYVDADGHWDDPKPDGAYNTVEYYEEAAEGGPVHFIGIIEDPGMEPIKTRIAFRVERDSLDRWADRLRELGAGTIEPSADMEAYPAIFFEDPAGTRLEVCARK